MVRSPRTLSTGVWKMAPRAFLGSIFGIMAIEIYSPIRLAKKSEEGKGYMIEHNTNDT